ncbi:MAG: hypothetical protein HOA17_01555 [Candidatus Melainabacteria bacterium]|jgi:hypothetical protein|nr:hypothetical protein [Candidatus Melainabacteria bacterium]
MTIANGFVKNIALGTGLLTGAMAMSPGSTNQALAQEPVNHRDNGSQLSTIDQTDSDIGEIKARMKMADQIDELAVAIQESGAKFPPKLAMGFDDFADAMRTGDEDKLNAEVTKLAENIKEMKATEPAGSFWNSVTAKGLITLLGTVASGIGFLIFFGYGQDMADIIKSVRGGSDNPKK